VIYNDYFIVTACVSHHSCETEHSMVFFFFRSFCFNFDPEMIIALLTNWRFWTGITCSLILFVANES